MIALLLGSIFAPSSSFFFYRLHILDNDVTLRLTHFRLHLLLYTFSLKGKGDFSLHKRAARTL
jgi:hypothetical protein